MADGGMACLFSCCLSWYLLWLLPFLRSATTLPLTIWTLSILSTYVVWYLRPLGPSLASSRMGSSA